MAVQDGQPVAPIAVPKRSDKRDVNKHGSLKAVKEDPSLPKVLHAKNFEHNFNVEGFIGGLTENLSESSQSRSGAIEPVTYSKTFSTALDHLLALQKQMSTRTRRLDEEMKIAERDYAGRLKDMQGDFEAVGTTFSSLEGKITGVGRTAMRIGEQLETLHHFRSLAQSVSLLLSYYLSVAQPPEPTKNPDGTETAAQTPLEALFVTRTTREGRTKLAVILRRLSALAKDVVENATAASHVGNTDSEEKVNPALKADLEKAERVREEVTRFSEQFEKEILRLFDKSYRKGDIKMMAHCAKTLQSFNGGTSCIQMYVNQHDFFISQDRFLEKTETVEGYDLPGDGDSSSIARDGLSPSWWRDLNDPSVPAPHKEPGLEALFEEIRLTVSQEAQIIQAVFPVKDEVMKVFLQRVFAQVASRLPASIRQAASLTSIICLQIQQHLEHLFSKAAAQGDLALLRMLRLTHVKCAALVEDLKRYSFTNNGQTITIDASEDKQAANSSPLTAMLDLCMEEMFMSYLDKGRYLELETRWLTDAYKEMLAPFDKYHLNIIKSKPNSLLDRVVNQLSSSSAITTTTPNHPLIPTVTGPASTAAAWLHKYGGVANTFGGTGTGTHSIAASGRASPAPSGAATPRVEDSSQLDPIAMKPKGHEREAALETQMAETMLKLHAEAVGRVVELSLPGDVPKNTNIIAHVLMDSIGRNYMELALDSLIARLDVYDGKVEPPIAGLLALKQTDLILHLWQRYSATAILPLAASSITVRKQYSQANASATTRIEGKANSLLQKTIDEPCRACCDFLERLKGITDRSLSGKNATSFLMEVGMVFHGLLLEHFKKFPVNPTGGLMLTKDLAAYQDVAKKFGIPEINERFEMLRQLGNSFIVQPEVLRSYLTEAHLGKIDARLLRPYLAQRSDFSSFSRRFLEDEGLAGTEVPTADESSKQGLSRGSRLSIGAGSGMLRLRELLKAVDEHAFGHDRLRTEKHDFSDHGGKTSPMNHGNTSGRPTPEVKETRPGHQTPIPAFVMPIV
ncbi:hypothetical protein QFC22_000747 [Naganishia vaughanmartiniae]|uniref:Uncharacterized protein n=1 Tax=Naganishia vaughanmartiniae TaxID=1424756 RepID=A0ACC2XLQ2_9TREE|nr:hypothetical protein QFC22_000747 [Naganishia vaughanmartiniae]